MKIKQRERDGVTVLDVSGEMYGGPENMKLVEIATELVEAKQLDLIINCKKVKWISSTGLGILVTARNRYAKGGGVLRLCDLNKKTLDVITITNLHLLLNIHGTEDEAMEAVAAG
jgi:anti-sigma B factor antagonist